MKPQDLARKARVSLSSASTVYDAYVMDTELPPSTRLEGLRHAIAEAESAQGWLSRLLERLTNEQDDLERFEALPGLHDVGPAAPAAGSARVHAVEPA